MSTMTVLLLGLILGLAAGAVAGARWSARTERAAAERRERLLLRNSDLAGVLGPLRDSLGRVESQLAEVERGRARSDSSLREQVRAMTDSSELVRAQAAQLVTALRAPQVRGRWGELQLQRVVEAAGMVEHVDYDTQVTVGGEDGAARPDLVVHLTGGRHVVVDAKVPLQAYLDSLDVADEAARRVRLVTHARQLRVHIDALAAKGYWERFSPAPEFVVCFLPADSILDAALRAEPDLLEHGFARNVIIATPATLVALLRTVAYGWRQEALAENAARVHELGRDLYKRLSTLGAHVDRMGRSLTSAVGAYNDAVGSLERMVFPKARQLSELGVLDPGSRLAPVEPLTTAIPRPTTAPEFGTVRAVPRSGSAEDQSGENTTAS